MARTTAIRTTIEPGRVIKVDDSELLDLERQGLIKSREGDKGWKADDSEAPASPDDKKEAE